MGDGCTLGSCLVGSGRAVRPPDVDLVHPGYLGPHPLETVVRTAFERWLPILIVAVVMPERGTNRSDSPRRRRPGPRGVVAARGGRHPGLAQDGADRLDPELLAVLVDVVDQH